MDARECWQIIRLSRARASGNIITPAQVIVGELAARSVDEMIAFNDWLRNRMLDAHRGAILVGARWIFAANGLPEVSVDSWEYLRAWLVGRGRKGYEAVLADADALADHFVSFKDFRSGESIERAALRAYERATGGLDYPDAFFEPCVGDMTPDLVPEDNLSSEELMARFPKLTAKFGPPKFL
jgi:hypothetical protein